MSNHIHVILTGGTIEKAYDPLTEKPEFIHRSIVPKYLEGAIKVYPDMEFEAVCQIDSMDMNPERRESIRQAIERTESKKIMIVHGTSTMAETAQHLQNHLKATDKTIIITGAMIPLKEFAMSDGGFNLGYALARLENEPAGIYLAMNAKLFAPQDVTKNTGIGRFETL